MIRLGSREPYWLDLAEGVRVQVRPLTTPAYAMIQAQAERVYEDWAEHRAKAEGLDPAEVSVRQGLLRALMIKGLALYGITAWEGVDAEADEPNIAAFIDGHPLLAALFYHRYLAPLEERSAEGNASGPAPHGTSAAGPSTARPAGTTDVSAGASAPTAPTSP
jgi:hypothetical protein